MPGLEWCERHDAVCGTAVRQRDQTWPTCEFRVGCLNTTVQKNGYEGKVDNEVKEYVSNNSAKAVRKKVINKEL